MAVTALVQFLIVQMDGYHALDENVNANLVLLAKLVRQVRHFFQHKENVSDEANKQFESIRLPFGNET